MATVLTNAGRDILTNRIKGAGTEPVYVGWGTGSTTAAAADTAIQSENTPSGGVRATGTSSRVTTSVANDTYQVVGTNQASSGITIANAGLLDSATVGAGNLFIHGDFTGVALNNGDQIQFTVKLQFT